MTDTLFILARQSLPQTTGTCTALHAADPFGAGRQILFQDATGYSGGHVAFSGEVDISGLTHAEVIVMLRGRLTLASGQEKTCFDVGEALVLPRGFSGKALAEDAIWAFTSTQATAAPADDSRVVPLEPGLDRPRSPGPATEVLVGPAPECHSLNLFTDAGGMRAGVWDVSTPCERRFVPHRVHELMHFIEGEVELRHLSGTAMLFRAGDTILVPRGAPYAWKSDARVVKYYSVL
jgi:uncharacterized cupin superfamily protein